MFDDITEATTTKSGGLHKPFARLSLGDYLHMDAIQGSFDEVPLDTYVSEGFRHKSIVRVRTKKQCITESDHGPLFQSKQYNPVHGDVIRHYAKMDVRLVKLLSPLIQIFAACGQLSHEHEILVQAQRITASSGDDSATGFPAVEGWHQDTTNVLGIFVVNRVNVNGGISMLSLDQRGTKLAFAQTLANGELLLIDDTMLWHNTTPIAKVRPQAQGYRDVVIMTWPSCREPRRASYRPKRPREASGARERATY